MAVSVIPLDDLCILKPCLSHKSHLPHKCAELSTEFNCIKLYWKTVLGALKDKDDRDALLSSNLKEGKATFIHLFLNKGSDLAYPAFK